MIQSRCDRMSVPAEGPHGSVDAPIILDLGSTCMYEEERRIQRIARARGQNRNVPSSNRSQNKNASSRLRLSYAHFYQS